MKKLMVIAALATTLGFATDFSTMSNQDLAKMEGNVPANEKAAFDAEVDKRIAQMPKFSYYDFDSDGQINETEFLEGHKKRMDERTAEGRMMRNAGNAPSFADIDTDKNGKVSPEEFRHHQILQLKNPNKGMMMQGQGMKCGGNGPGMGMGRGMGMGKMRMRQMPQFSDCDLNNDGQIVENEFLEARAKRMNERAEEGRMMKNAGNAPSFGDIDTDKNGKITPEEFHQHQMQQMQNPNKGMMKCNGNGMNMKCNTAK
ncbi:MAG: DUF1104 domain-containing protein [Campylobacterales bacterium]|nr:DUF1104 domain-containing protein [Campylobacterales bacterium]